MTGDAVNDAAALKQADIGVAMGSGSEVTKQAARMILTDDNFGTLVHAVEIGRRVYEKVVAYVRYQMTQLLSLVMLFVAATAFNINQGVALTPSMVLYLLFFVTVAGVVVIAVDPGDPDVMHRPPRDPKVPITNRTAVLFWLLYAVVLFLAALTPLVAGPDQPSPDRPSASMTMTFVVMGLGTVFNALTNRRDPASGLTPPILQAVAISVVPVVAPRVGHRDRLPAAEPADPRAHRHAVVGLYRSRARAPGRDRSQQVDPSITRTQAPRDRPDASGHTRTRPRRRSIARTGTAAANATRADRAAITQTLHCQPTGSPDWRPEARWIRGEPPQPSVEIAVPRRGPLPVVQVSSPRRRRPSPSSTWPPRQRSCSRLAHRSFGADAATSVRLLMRLRPWPGGGPGGEALSGVPAAERVRE